MKEILKLQSEYNEITNREMIAIIKNLDGSLINKDFGLYYKSIIGTLNHILYADIIWIKRFFSFCPEIENEIQKLPEMKKNDYKEIQWQNINDFEQARYNTDAIIIDIFKKINEDKYQKKFKYKNFKGEFQTKTAWKAFIHMFNHQTHHRGQISAILDQLNVENDYSNLIWKFD